MKTEPDVLKQAVQQSGWLDEEIVAVGHLRQGKAPKMWQMILGSALWEVLRQRRSKLLPRHFVMVLTPDRVAAFKASAGGGGAQSSQPYTVNIQPGGEATFPRSSVSISDIPEGAKSKGGIMTIDGESFPVARANISGDPHTDETIGLLAASRARSGRRARRSSTPAPRRPPRRCPRGPRSSRIARPIRA